jgi:hypothetical protein
MKFQLLGGVSKALLSIGLEETLGAPIGNWHHYDFCVTKILIKFRKNIQGESKAFSASQ